MPLTPGTLQHSFDYIRVEKGRSVGAEQNTVKQTVYIETTIVSYLTSRPSRDLIVAAHQQVTCELRPSGQRPQRKSIGRVLQAGEPVDADSMHAGRDDAGGGVAGMWKDPIVEEVRKTRERLAREWQNAPGGMPAAQRAVFDQWTGGKVYYEQAHPKQRGETQVAEEQVNYGEAEESGDND